MKSECSLTRALERRIEMDFIGLNSTNSIYLISIGWFISHYLHVFYTNPTSFLNWHFIISTSQIIISSSTLFHNFKFNPLLSFPKITCAIQSISYICWSTSPKCTCTFPMQNSKSKSNPSSQDSETSSFIQQKFGIILKLINSGIHNYCEYLNCQVFKKNVHVILFCKMKAHVKMICFGIF